MPKGSAKCCHFGVGLIASNSRASIRAALLITGLAIARMLLGFDCPKSIVQPKFARSYFTKTTKLWVDRLIGTADPIAGGGMSARLKMSSVS